VKHYTRALFPGLAAVAATALVLLAGFPVSAAPTAMSDASHAALMSAAGPGIERRIAFRNAMGKYWEDHITWTRLFIISDLADSPDLPMTTQRLLQNQVDIGNAIKPYYGDAAGDQLTALLRDHILIAADVVAAAKAGDTPRLDDQMARWQANADEIGAFLGSANPDNWPAADLKAMMRQHLDLTTAEVVARLNGDWAGDIAAYDKVHLHILVLADVLTNGIVAQFPDAFVDGAQATAPNGE
jgi:hypothetical protein